MAHFQSSKYLVLARSYSTATNIIVRMLRHRGRGREDHNNWGGGGGGGAKVTSQIGPGSY